MVKALQTSCRGQPPAVYRVVFSTGKPSRERNLMILLLELWYDDCDDQTKQDRCFPSCSAHLTVPTKRDLRNNQLVTGLPWPPLRSLISSLVAQSPNSCLNWAIIPWIGWPSITKSDWRLTVVSTKAKSERVDMCIFLQRSHFLFSLPHFIFRHVCYGARSA